MRLRIFAAAVSVSACTAYNGVAVKGDDVYVTGVSHVFGISSGWLMKCRDVRGALICERVDTRSWPQGTLKKLESSAPPPAPSAPPSATP